MEVIQAPADHLTSSDPLTQRYKRHCDVNITAPQSSDSSAKTEDNEVANPTNVTEDI